MKLSYSILTPSKMEVIIDNKKIMITGEATTTPKFYADISSIKKWEPPFEDEIITENEKKKIIEAIEEYSQKGKIPVVFD